VSASPAERGFVRSAVGNTRVIASFCAACQMCVGFSTRPDVLTIAENAHHCDGGKRSSYGFALAAILP
jgi:hypothetical protein